MLLSLCSCNRNILNYYYSDTVLQEIQNGVAHLNQLTKSNNEKIVAYIPIDCNYSITLVPFKFLPENLKKICKRTNRFIRLPTGKNLPVIFEMDLKSDIIDHKTFGRINIGGYNITFNYEGHILSRGIIY